MSQSLTDSKSRYARWRLFIFFSLVAVTLVASSARNLPDLVELGYWRVAQTVQPAVATYRLLPAKSREKTHGPLRVDPDNPRYLVDQLGHVVFLAGSNYWNLLQDGGRTNPPPAFNYAAFVQFAVEHNFNYLRWHTWEHTQHKSFGQDWYIRPTIYRRTGPGRANDGEARFDLRSFNPEFFNRLRSRVETAGDHGLYVAVNIFQAFSVADGNTMTKQWAAHPFHRENNVNGVDGDPTRQGNGKDTQTLVLPEVTEYQQKYVEHLIDSLHDLDNVIWEVAIEPDGKYSRDGHDSFTWVAHFVEYIRACEARRTVKHPILYSSLFPGGKNASLLASHADIVAPNADGGFERDAPLLDGRKVVLIDTDHIAWTEVDGADWAWKAFTRGAGGYAIMDGGYSDYDDQGGGAKYAESENFRFNLGWIRWYSRRIGVKEMRPRMDSCSTAYCLALAVEGQARHLAYLPAGRTVAKLLGRFGIDVRNHPLASTFYLPTDSVVTVDLSQTPGTFRVEWFSPESGRTVVGDSVAGGARREFIAPFPGGAVLYLDQQR